MLNIIKQLSFADHKPETRTKEFTSTVFFDVVKDTYGNGSRPFHPSQQNERPKEMCAHCQHHKIPGCFNLRDPGVVSVVWGLRPILVLMKYLGLLHVRGKGRFGFSKSLGYSVAIFLLSWFNCLRFFFAYPKGMEFGSQLFLRTTLHVFYGQVALVVTIYLFKISPGLPMLFKKWDDFVYFHHCMSGKYLRTLSTRAILVGSVLILCWTSLSVVVLIWDDEMSMDTSAVAIMLPFHRLDSPPLVYKLLFAVLCFFMALIWIFPTSLLVVICWGLRHNFHHITENFTDRKKDLDYKSIGDLRKRHQKLCRLVMQTDQLFSLYNLTVYIACIPLLCFVIYNFAFGAFDGHALSLTLAVAKMVIIVTQMGMVTSAASAVCMQASAPIQSLFEVELFDPDHKENQVHTLNRAIQVTIFLQRINHSHIGLTAWNLFNINKQTIVMVTTMVLSYVFVMIKFGLTLEFEPKNGEGPASAEDIAKHVMEMANNHSAVFNGNGKS